MVACGDSLLDRNVDAIVTIAIDTSLIKPVIAKAKANEFRSFRTRANRATATTPATTRARRRRPPFSPTRSSTGSKQVTDKPAQVIIQDYPAPWAADRTEVFKEKLRKRVDIEIVADTQTDATQLLEYTRKTVSDQLTQHKDVDAFWFSFDATGQAGGPVIARPTRARSSRSGR